MEGGRKKSERQIEYYNLDVIISVGYRVKFKQGTQFRIWATNAFEKLFTEGLCPEPTNEPH
ncbi:MAG: RhuM family protein [Candidatus Marinimicrobia bacterium]|nr:RhuM family protein [Candidatus Neomarinimicrobiota bacterium]